MKIGPLKTVIFTTLGLLSLNTGCSQKDEKGQDPPALEQRDTAPLATIPGLPERNLDAPLAELFSKTNPYADEKWTSEAFTKAVEAQLHKIVGALANRGSFDEVQGGIASCVSTGYRGPPLRPDTVEVFKDDAISVSRSPSKKPGTPIHKEPAGFQQSLSQFVEHIGPGAGEQIKAEFKIVRVETSAKTAKTVVLFETICVQPRQKLQHTFTWNCSWVKEGGNPNPLLSTITVSAFEEVIYTSALPGFTNATHSLMGNEPSFRDQMLHGSDYWYGNLDVAFDIHQGNHGISIGDANGDGLEDLYICQPAGLPNLLYLRKQDGTLRDVTSTSGLNWLDGSRSALFADFDNDGDQDMVIGLEYSLGLFENNGLGKFTLTTTVEINSWPQSIATADFDNDGDLDLFVCGYSPRGKTNPGDIFANPVPYHDANNGARNFMLENTGKWLFADITEAVGMNINNRRFSFAATWEDYDNDGDQDLYVANDFGRNNLYRNELIEGENRRFTDVAAQAGVEDISAGMSVSWGDYNRDGWTDLYVSNMFSAAGNRITFQRQFKPGTDDLSRKHLQRHARGNTLFENTGKGTFKDVSLDAGVTMGRWAWGSGFTDINNDGWQDLYVTNGFFTAQDTEDL